MATAKPVAQVHVICNSDGDTDALTSVSCTACIHASCLVKHGHDKLAKKSRGQPLFGYTMYCMQPECATSVLLVCLI